MVSFGGLPAPGQEGAARSLREKEGRGLGERPPLDSCPPTLIQRQSREAAANSSPQRPGGVIASRANPL